MAIHAGDWWAQQLLWSFPQSADCKYGCNLLDRYLRQQFCKILEILKIILGDNFAELATNNWTCASAIVVAKSETVWKIFWATILQSWQPMIGGGYTPPDISATLVAKY